MGGGGPAEKEKKGGLHHLELALEKDQPGPTEDGAAFRPEVPRQLDDEAVVLHFVTSLICPP